MNVQSLINLQFGLNIFDFHDGYIFFSPGLSWFEIQNELHSHDTEVMIGGDS